MLHGTGIFTYISYLIYGASGYLFVIISSHLDDVFVFKIVGLKTLTSKISTHSLGIVQIKHPKLGGGFNPSEKIIYSQIGSFPQVEVKIKGALKPPPRKDIR